LNEDKATRYHRLQRTLTWIGLALQAAGIVVLLPGGGAVLLRDAVVGATGAAPTALTTVGLFTAVLIFAADLAVFPVVFYRSFVLERRYGLSTISLRVWLLDHLKAFGLGLTLGVVGAVVVYATLTLWPAAWWLVSTAVFSGALLGLAWIAPSVLLPMFYSFKPLEHPSLRLRLESLSSRAGVPVLGIYEWGLGEKSTRANAALVGTGRRRRILLSNTLLSDYTEDEIEVVIAHELGHHAHRDISVALMLQIALVIVTFGAAAVALEAFWRPLGLIAQNDAAGLPLLMLVAAIVSMTSRLPLNAMSRRNEHRADRFALSLTGRPEAFVSAMRRLGAQNLAEANPSATTVWLFHSHPTVEQRIRAARAFEG